MFYMKKHLSEKIKNKESGILLYGITPPKINTDHQRILDVVEKQCDRLRKMDVDGVIIYDLQDESSRTQVPRPFPYIETIASDEYGYSYMKDLDIPKIIYKSVGKFTSESFKEWASKVDPDFMVLVGSPSKNHSTGISLNESYEILRDCSNNSILGGITIPERHTKSRNEHIHIENKKSKGCEFFISQCVYDINATKNFISDYYYHNLNNEGEVSPIIFSLTPCGSIKTLEFSKWLGIQIPTWIENELLHTHDILAESIQTCTNIASELIEFCDKKNIPIGFNIESIAIRKEEIEASVELLNRVKKLFQG